MSIDYAKMDKHVSILDGKKSGCKSMDGEFQCRIKIPITHQNDKKAKEYGFIIETGVPFTEKVNEKDVEFVWYVSCRIIDRKHMIKFHNDLSEDEQTKVLIDQHKVNYRSNITTPGFNNHMGVVKVSENQSKKIHNHAIKLIMSKRSIMIENTMKIIGCTQKQAEELYQKTEDDAIEALSK